MEHDDAIPPRIGGIGPLMAALAGMLALVLAVTAMCLPTPADRAARAAGLVDAAIAVSSSDRTAKVKTITVHDETRPEGTVLDKGAGEVTTDTWVTVKATGERIKVDSRVTARPRPRIVTTRKGGASGAEAGDITKPGGEKTHVDRLGAADDATDPNKKVDGHGNGTGSAGDGTTDSGTTDNDMANGDADTSDDADTDAFTAGFIGSLELGGVGMLEGTPVTWADVSVLGVDNETMRSRGVRADMPLTLTEDTQGVWRAADGSIAVGAPADVPLGTIIDTRLGKLTVVDHDISGTYNIMTTWRAMPRASLDPTHWADAVR